MDISIIIPTFNRMETLKKGLETLVVQKGTENINWEVIIVDNGSTDDTKQAIHPFFNLIKNLKYCYIEQEKIPNRSKVRNYGFSKCTGEYISFLDSGMLVSDNYISTIYENRKNYKLIFHYMYGVYAEVSEFNNDIVKSIDVKDISITYNKIKNRNDWIDKREMIFDLPKNSIPAPWVLGWGGAISFSRDVFTKINGFDENIFGWGGEDSDISQRLIKNVPSYLFCKKSYAIHLPHKNEPSEEKTKFSILNREKIHRKNYTLDTELYLLYPSLYLNYFLNRIQTSSLNLLAPINYPDNIKNILKSILIKSSKSAYGHVESLDNVYGIDADYYFVLRTDKIKEFHNSLPGKNILNLLGIRTPLKNLELDVFILNDSLRGFNRELAELILNESYTVSKATYLIYTKNYESLKKKINNEPWMNLDELDEICSSVSLKLTLFTETKNHFIFEVVNDTKLHGSSTFIQEFQQ